MLLARLTSLLGVLVTAGCLQPGPLPEGHKLALGRDIGSISFVLIDSDTVPDQKDPWVAFNRQKALATPSKGAVSDLWIASWDGAQQRLVIAGRSDRLGGGMAGGSLFTMVDERQVTSGGAGGGQVESVGTLVRIDSHYQPNVRFENVSTFTLSGYDNRLLYRQVPEDNETAGLFLWDGQDSLRLGDVANLNLLNMQMAGSGMAYFVLGTDRVLSRLDKLTDTKQDLHANVSRFLLSPDEKYVALSLSTTGTSTTVVLDVQAGKDIPLARPNPCCWLGFPQSTVFSYVQSASAGSPAEYHTLDLASGIDTTLVLPAPLVDLPSFAFLVARPQSDEVLYLDSQGHGVFFGLDQQVRRTVPVRMLSPRFSDDGRYLIYIDPQLPTQLDPDPHGPLMVQDSDLLQPPRQLSTPGMSVRTDNFFFIDGPTTDAGVSQILVFWASIVRGTADLYFANHETGELQVVATSIGTVTVDSQRIFGTIHVSSQDAVGDLVVSDVQDNGGRTLAHAVSEFAQSPYWIESGNLVAYVVRGRAPSDHDGLWGSTLAPPSQDGGP